MKKFFFIASTMPDGAKLIEIQFKNAYSQTEMEKNMLLKLTNFYKRFEFFYLNFQFYFYKIFEIL